MLSKFINGTPKELKEQDVKNLTNLGFEKDKVIKALKENDYNADRAADSLLKSTPGKN